MPACRERGGGAVCRIVSLNRHPRAVAMVSLGASPWVFSSLLGRRAEPLCTVEGNLASLARRQLSADVS